MQEKKEGDPSSSKKPANCMQQTFSLFSKEKTLKPSCMHLS
jgi:hypothetical protein